MKSIGTLNEKPLHSALKDWYALPGDQYEAPIDGYIVDLVRDDLLIEIQTGGFSSIRRKVQTLAENHRLRLVYPVVVEKWIVTLAKNGTDTLAGRRRSPKRGTMEQVFKELVSFPKLIANPNFSLEVLLIREEEVRRYDRRRGWRRKGWILHERRLLEVIRRHVFEEPADVLSFIPPNLDEPWSSADLAAAVGQPRWLVQKMVYCLREMGAIRATRKLGNAILYVKVP